MKKYSVLLLLSSLLLASQTVVAQMSGDNIFLPGHFVQVAIADNGSFGSTVSLPSGYYHNSPTQGVYDHATGSYTSTNSRLAFIYDAGHDGWTTGSPAYFGDYTMPGSPYEGWSIQINGTQSNAWYTNYQSSASGFSGGGTLAGSNISYTNAGGRLTALWKGSAGTSGVLKIEQTTYLDTNASWIKVTTKFKNTGSSALPNVYYMRAFDPDNDQTSSGSYNTRNTINYQNDYYHRVMVTAAGTSYTTQTVALATKDCRAKCFRTLYGSWPTGGTSCATYWGGSASNTAYSGSGSSDDAIGLVYNLGTIAAGDSTTISYAFVFNGSIGIDSAYSEPSLIVGGVAMDTIDTVTACTFTGDTLYMSIINGNTNNWDRSKWTWAPNTSLLTDTGVSTGVILSGLSGPITYTITGTDTAIGSCEHKVFLLTVYPTTTAAPGVADVYYCIGATATPLTASGSSLLWYTTATGGTGSTTAPTPSTSAAGTTSYYVSQTIAGCESPRDTINVIVTPGAAAITGPTNVCRGLTVTVSNTTTGGTWVSSNPSVASIGSTTGVITGVSVGTATISYQMSSGCYVTASITVNNQPGTISGPSVVCQGATITLSDTTSVGSWTSSNTGIATIGGTTGVLTGVSTGTVTVSFTTPAVCFVTYSVTVNPSPSNISGPSTVCAGSTASLFATPSGGTWSSVTTSVATITSSGVVTGVSTGSSTISYVLSTGCYSTLSETVIALPTTITGGPTVCVGSTINLGSTPTSGTWTSSNTSVGTIGYTSGILTGVSSGTTNVTYTAPTGCQIATTITVNPQPSTISGPSAVCALSTITLSSTPSTGTWTSSTGSIATVGASTGTVTGVASGATMITYTLGTTGCYVTRGITVNPIPAAITGTMYLCASGGITNLYDATSGGVWSSSNTGLATVNSSGLVTGITAGSLYITYTNPSTGCYVTTPVTVNALPTTISGPSDFCVNSTASFSDGSSGGTWSSSNTGIATIHPSSGLATGVSAGSAIITYSLGTGCTVTANITVNPLPTAITGTTSVCEAGSMTNLYDATGGGYWVSGNTSLATVDASGMVTGVSSGAVNISYVLYATTCAISTVVTVNPLPAAISGPTAVCAGSTINLSDATPSGSWSSGTTSVATVTSGGMVTGVSNGTSDITYTLPTGCLVTSTISVNPLPATITGTAVVCATLTTVFSNTVSGGTWSSGTSSIATVNTSGVITGVMAGTAVITYSLGTGCLVTKSVTVNPLPAAITGASDVCNTFTTVYSDITGGGTWSSGSSSIASISGTGTITGVSPGTTTITYTLGTGCLQTLAITVDPLPAAISGATHVCVASSTTLTDASGTGTWTSSNTSVATIGSTTGTVTGVLAGTATITFTAPGGCYITSTMTVDPLPSAITGSGNVCEGSTMTLSNSSGTGTWTSSSTALATVGTSSGVVTGVTAGTINITFTLGTSCYITRTIVINPTPTAITGTPEVCEAGSVTTLGDALAGGSWTTSNTAIATATSASTTTGNITGVTAGTVTVTYTVGTCYNTQSVIVHPLPNAIITPLGDTTMCPGGFVVLSASYGTGYGYQWINTSGAISGETDDYYMATTGSNYRVQVTSTHGCVSVSSPMAVSITPATATLAAAGATTVCAGSVSTLNANTGSGLTYQWMLGGAGITGATGSTYNAISPGSYNVIVSNSAGCSATSSSVTVTTLPTPSNNVVLSGSPTFCTGGSVILTADAGTGYTYQWTLGGSNITGATDINYTATASGNYQVLVTNSYPCSSTSAVATITALPLPNAAITATSSTTFCTGSSVGMFVAAATGNTYQWYKNGTAISGATASVYTSSTGGNFAVHVTSAVGCSSTTSPAFAVMEVTTPIITPYTTTSFCWGGSAFLGVSVTVTTGVTYQWQMNGVDILGATNSTYSAGATGDYSCVVNIPGGCTTAAIAVSVVEYPLPNPIVTFDGLTLSTGNFYVSYQWFRNYNPIAGVGPSIIPENTGTYTVRVVDTNGCQSVATGYIVTRIADNRILGVNNVNTDDIQIFPNPAQNIVHVVSTTPLRAVINAIDGRKVLDVAEAKDIDISQLAEGVYMLLLFDAEGQMIKAEKLTKN